MRRSASIFRGSPERSTSILSAPVSYIEIVVSYVGAAATKSIILGLIILATAGLFVPLKVLHPLWMILFLVLTSVTFSLLGFIIGIWADGFEKLQLVPLLIVTPLTFLGGSFYSIDMLPPVWQTVTLFNPVVYLISGFRWSFYGIADVSVAVSLGMTIVFLAHLPRDRRLDLQDRLSAEDVARERASWSQRSSRSAARYSQARGKALDGQDDWTRTLPRADDRLSGETGG